MCTVLLRFDPGSAWPVLLAAVRDEFVDRSWDPPAAHWTDLPTVQGGRDRLGGGTWLAVDRAGGVVAALLNGVRRSLPPDGSVRPTRGTLALAALPAVPVPAAPPPAVPVLAVPPPAPPLSAVPPPAVPLPAVPGVPDVASLARYDGFHLLRANTRGAEVWSWDGVDLVHQRMIPGDHIVVNLGVDRRDDPLVPHFLPLLRSTPSAEPRPGGDTEAAWDGWVDLLRGGGLGLTDPRALIIAHEYADHVYGSTSASLVGLSESGTVRYDFTATPTTPDWYEIPILDRR